MGNSTRVRRAVTLAVGVALATALAPIIVTAHIQTDVAGFVTVGLAIAALATSRLYTPKLRRNYRFGHGPVTR